MNIKIGDLLELREFDWGEIIVEEVTSIENKDTDDPCFQIRTKNLDYDFTNFYEIVKVYTKY